MRPEPARPVLQLPRLGSVRRRRSRSSRPRRFGGSLSAIEVVGRVLRSPPLIAASSEQDEDDDSYDSPQQPRMLKGGSRRPDLLVDAFSVGIGPLCNCRHGRFAARSMLCDHKVMAVSEHIRHDEREREEQKAQ